MNFPEPEIALRPRTGAEAIDLGLRLCQQHAGLLFSAQALLILSFLLAGTLLTGNGLLMFFLLWWLKPAWERMSLLILSHHLFGDPIGLRQALRQWLRLCRQGLIGDLLWRRFSLSRSYRMPLLLEGLDAAGRRRRGRELGTCGAARWLTTFGAHLEFMLGFSLPLLVLFFAPGAMPDSAEGWMELVQNLEQTPWLDDASNLLYALTLVFWGPFYTAGGISLYMNRRCEREAWDLELVFRKLASRLAAPLLALLCLLPVLPQVQAAEELQASEPETLCPLPEDDSPIDPDALRLTSQPLDSLQARQAIAEVLESPPYRNIEEHIQWTPESDAADTDEDQDPAPPQLPLWVAQLVEMLLWSLVLAGVLLLIWRYRDWLTLYAGRLLPAGGETEPEDEHSLLRYQPLPPEQLESQLRALWSSDPRQALALFYACLLGDLEQRLDQPIGQDLTESDVRRLVEARLPLLQGFTGALLRARIDSAYGHRQPPAGLLEQLLGEWKQLQRRPA